MEKKFWRVFFNKSIENYNFRITSFDLNGRKRTEQEAIDFANGRFGKENIDRIEPDNYTGTIAGFFKVV